ncbi:hypothetical protein L596_013633 [Steinernema carpocapsae]|uniref:Uncharacterized protein n=1 Tax=Steinernema carpocapsae TaxID=34508 RepID=A0A4U5P0R6_STECR|nr:hypothetical protein L596_013633 [Steinernema carpocapsae]
MVAGAAEVQREGNEDARAGQHRLLLQSSVRMVREPARISIGFGDWALVTIVPSSTGLVRWVMEPEVTTIHPILQLFCGNLDAEFNLMGAIAFNNLLKTTADFRIFDTSMGKAWVPTELFHGDAVDFVARVQCPEQCFCFSEAPRSPAPSQCPGSSYESRVSQCDGWKVPQRFLAPSQRPGSSCESRVSQCDGWKVPRRSPAPSQRPDSLYESSRRSPAPTRRPGNLYELRAPRANGWGDLPQPGPNQRSWDNVVGYAGYDDEEDSRFNVRRREAPRSGKIRFDLPGRRCSDSPPDDPTLDGGPSFSEALRPKDAVRRPMVFQKSTRREEELQPNSRRSSGGRFANLRVVGRDAHQEEVDRPPTDEEVRSWEEALEASYRERMEAQDYEAPSQESQEAIEADRALVPVSHSQDDSCTSSVSTSPSHQQAPSVDTLKKDPTNKVQVVQEAQSEDETDDSDEDVLSQPGERHANDAEDVEMFDVDSEEDE